MVLTRTVANCWTTSSEHTSTPRPPECNGNPCYAFRKKTRIIDFYQNLFNMYVHLSRHYRPLKHCCEQKVPSMIACTCEFVSLKYSIRNRTNPKMTLGARKLPNARMHRMQMRIAGSSLILSISVQGFGFCCFVASEEECSTIDCQLYSIEYRCWFPKIGVPPDHPLEQDFPGNPQMYIVHACTCMVL